MLWPDPQSLRPKQLWPDPLPELWAGLDEVGRGPLAGVVTAAAVVLPPGEYPACLDELDDSKCLTCEQRERLSKSIKEVSVAYSIAHVSPNEIDEVNILNASMKAMRQALDGLNIEVQFAFVDGNRLPDLPCRGQAVIKGDSRVASIAAASVLAKVERDRIMTELDEEHPVYGFKWNKGYGTQFHYQALNFFGPSCIHRQSFRPVRNAKESSRERQASLLEALLFLRELESLEQMEGCFNEPAVKKQCQRRDSSAFLRRYVEMRKKELKSLQEGLSIEIKG